MINRRAFGSFYVALITAVFVCALPARADCPRIQLDAQQGVGQLCRNTMAGANQVPLFQAMARMWLGEELPAANQMLRQAYSDLLDGAAEMTPEIADERAKWQMRLWVRAYFLFNERSGWFPGRLEPETESCLHELFWNYAFAKSTRERAELRYVWFIQGSENHDLMDLSNAFLALQALQHVPEYQDRLLRDGASVADHVRAWKKYYRTYADERVARGLLVECASSIYGKYSIPELTNLADFSDDAILQRKMTMFLDVLWADWAVEQLDGVRGGGKSRVYQGKYSRFGDRDSYRQMSDVLLGQGSWVDGRHGHTNSGFVYCLATSRYRLPQVVRALVDSDQRASYVSISRRPAKMTGTDKLPDHLPHPCWYVLDSEDTRAVRYTYCTPDYVLGSWHVDPALAESVVVREGEWRQTPYAAIHSQNRWQGVIFRQGVNARVYPQCMATKHRDEDGPYSVSNHQQIAVQHENVMIAQANLARKDIVAMRVYVADGIRENLVRRDGWWMSVVGDALVAFQGIDPDRGATSSGEWEQENYFRLANWRSPVLIVAERTARFSDLDEFARHLTDLQYQVKHSVLTVSFTDTAQQPTVLTVDLEQHSLPAVNGRPIDLNPPRVYDSPYLQSEFGSGRVTIRCRDQAYVWNMAENTIE